MDRMKGLRELVKSKEYREALNLPKEVQEEYSLLAQGEYNINYKFIHPVTKEALLLRVNCGSQMHLEHQIEYEANALKLLEQSGRTPCVLYVDGSKKWLDHGILVMEYLPGRALDYSDECNLAAECLADIHSVQLNEEEKKTLLAPNRPLEAILKECEEMLAVYLESEIPSQEKKDRLRKLLDAGWKMLKDVEPENDVATDRKYRCCINTELNSTNFLINGNGQKNYLIDWEKPLYGEPAQDLGHFLAPTTTFWKTDVILTKEQMMEFVENYIRYVDGRFDTQGLWERVEAFVTITCLRGLTWCAMAWVEYQQPNKLIFNLSTFNKLKDYLSDEFLVEIEKRFGAYL